MSEDITLQVAQMSIKTWADQVMEDHYAAEDCCKCERFLEAGITAQSVVASVDAIYREADNQGVRRYSSAVRILVRNMFNAWLEKSQQADVWIEGLRGTGYTPDNLKRYDAAKQAVTAWLEEYAWAETSRRSLAKMITDDV